MMQVIIPPDGCQCPVSFRMRFVAAGAHALPAGWRVSWNDTPGSAVKVLFRLDHGHQVWTVPATKPQLPA
jgi:hypothetical protein